MTVLLGAVLTSGAFVSIASAQSSPDTSPDLPDRFQVDVGYFRISADTTLRFNGPIAGSDVVFERDLGVPSDANTFWVDGTWRISRRNQVKVSYTRFDRDRAGFSLQRDFTWGGVTYTAGLSANATTGSDILGGYYRFAVFRNDRFEIGPTAGAGYLRVRADIQATGSLGRSGGPPASQTIDRSESTGSPTGAVGGYATVWPAKRLAVRADLLYIKAHIGDSHASITDGRIGADYYFVRNVGVGVQYKYNRYTYDRDITSTALGGQITYKGFQIFASLLF